MKTKYWLPVTLLVMIHSLMFGQKPVRKGVKPVVIEKSKEPAFSVGQIQGKWQEAFRYNNKTKKAIGFNDTMMIYIQGDMAETRDGSSNTMNIKGPVEIESPNTLLLAGDVYTIVSVTKNSMVLNDGNVIHELKLTKSFSYEAYGKERAEPQIFNKPGIIDIKNLEGKWHVYRRQAAPSDNEHTYLIRSLEVTTITGEQTATGKVVFYSPGESESVSCTVILNNGSLKIITDKHTWDLFTYKADGKEFVFGKAGEILYYSKH